MFVANARSMNDDDFDDNNKLNDTWKFNLNTCVWTMIPTTEDTPL